jgi:hypothetical protein
MIPDSNLNSMKGATMSKPLTSTEKGVILAVVAVLALVGLLIWTNDPRSITQPSPEEGKAEAQRKATEAAKKEADETRLQCALTIQRYFHKEGYPDFRATPLDNVLQIVNPYQSPSETANSFMDTKELRDQLKKAGFTAIRVSQSKSSSSFDYYIQ